MGTLSVGWHGADRFVRAAHDRGLRWLFHPVGVVLQAVVAIAGTIAIVSTLTSGADIAWVTEPWMVPALIAIDIAAR